MYDTWPNWREDLEADARECGISVEALIEIRADRYNAPLGKKRTPARRIRGNKYVKFREFKF